MTERDITLVELGATLALERLGLTAGELSQRQARKVYGAYFDTLCKQGRIAPAHTEAGHAGTRWFRVADILALQTEYSAQAFLLNSYHNEKETH
jgi:hypothetical protein